ncbi:glycoside hydrolase family 3 protein [Baudoinia panamericana UAMH 10762]|uniref:Probable beta-glucosidase I n=1 Tax=Baudoinia panamericana (strain UAMH 10762) TaxID=717646 RepID=M2NND3_BAUPA|nr:glycoside hydrolase family 3 protein [Baudoinia panamericana UAMH 10762]EMD00746.1 glycoside hydrolase family 3 protein [Baudoinia panamericana UAMH 10762]
MASIDVEEVLLQLTLDEKISLLAGTDFWHTAAIPNHGVPALRMSDGPNGVRGTRVFNGVPAACFPCGTALGSTWNQELLLDAGKLMGEEAKAKGAHILLGPCINMQRSPLGGRGFESISEDPVLAGLGAACLINGIQSTGVVATIKHFVTNDQEHERNAVDSIVTDRALHEIYLLPFQIAVRDSHPKAFMTAYNKLNGTHLSENKRILQDILRDELGWRGAIMSDWFGTYGTAEAINAGLDIEMPGPTRYRGQLLGHNVTARKVAMHTLNERARNVLELVKNCAESGIKEGQVESKLDTPETSALLRRLAGESIVLVKNRDNALPLAKGKGILMIGPNAKVSVFCGGGSSSMAPYYAISPWEGVESKVKDPSKMQHAIGCYSHKELPLVSHEFHVGSDPKSKKGLVFKAYNEPPTVGKDRLPVDELELTSSLAMFMDYHNPKLKSDLWYADVEGYFTAERSGDYELGLCIYGTGNIYVDGHLVVDNTTKQKQGSVFYGCGSVEEKGTIPVEKGKTYHVVLDFASAPTSKLEGDGIVRFGGGGFRIGGAWVRGMDETIKEAADLAKSAEQVVICAGLNQDWEGEGADRVDMKLPGRMDDLIAAVAAANPKTIVVMQTGTPVEMPWLEDVSGLLQAWYGGNETGNAIADALFGDINPSGRSSLSWPKRLEDNPAFYNYRSEGGRVLYGEDVYVGYRHYDTVKREVNIPFGFGLSYTSFELSDLRVERMGEDELSSKVKVSVTVKNTGKLDGHEVVQVYVSQQSPGIRRPPRELKGFAKVAVKAGASATATVMCLTKYATSYWDEIRDSWVMEQGRYDVEVCDGSRQQQLLRTAFAVQATQWWRGL